MRRADLAMRTYVGKFENAMAFDIRVYAADQAIMIAKMLLSRPIMRGLNGPTDESFGHELLQEIIIEEYLAHTLGEYFEDLLVITGAAPEGSMISVRLPWTYFEWTWGDTFEWVASFINTYTDTKASRQKRFLEYLSKQYNEAELAKIADELPEITRQVAIRGFKGTYDGLIRFHKQHAGQFEVDSKLDANTGKIISMGFQKTFKFTDAQIHARILEIFNGFFVRARTTGEKITRAEAAKELASKLIDEQMLVAGIGFCFMLVKQDGKVIFLRFDGDSDMQN